MINTERQQKNSIPSFAGLVGWLLFSFAVAAFGSLFMPGDWYQQLEKPSWTPPGWLFGPVWTLLYIAMAVAAWLIWRHGGFRGNRAPLTFYLVQLLFNALWSWLFFGLHLIGVAAVDILLLLTSLIITTVLFWRQNRLAGGLLIPYAVWVSYASALNLEIWRLN